MLKIILSLKVSLFGLLAPALAPAAPNEADLGLRWPVACTPYVNCYVLHYPDLKIGTDPEHPRDFQCGARTRAGLLGTHIIFEDATTTAARQQVLAAADGRVAFLRTNVKGRSHDHPCGNEIHLRHVGGYMTRYCHLATGSTLVKAGQVVRAGQPLATIGQTGDVRQPKLFFALEHNGTPVDPFTARNLSAPSACFSTFDRSLWLDLPAKPPLAEVMTAGFLTAIPPVSELERATGRSTHMPATIDRLVSWVRVLGVKAGDVERITLTDPRGRLWAREVRNHPVDAPAWTAFIQTVRPQTTYRFPKGEWRMHYTLSRDGQDIATHTATITLM